MAKLNLDYYQGETEYSDGSFEDELLELYTEERDPEKLLRESCQWPVLYHLSPFRQNILNWYPFKKKASLLEIGAGCGALTGLFCERVASVTAVELTKRRGSINYERNKAYSNLEIRCGNFHNIEFTEKYDYIILNGVLEYAQSFTATDNPGVDFLKDIKKLLKPSGVLLIAIENRLGLKYLNGAPEDHTGKLFSGINDYPDTSSVRTYSKNELENVIADAGFMHTRFYYPNPDYKFPMAIFTDDTTGMIDYSTTDHSFNMNRVCLYNEDVVYPVLQEEGVIDKFFNSYLVEVSNTKLPKASADIGYVKLPFERRKKFCLRTVLLKDKNADKDSGAQKLILKTAMFPEARAHLLNMEKNAANEQKLSNYTYAPVHKKNGGLAFEFIPGKDLLTLLCEDLEHANEAAFTEKLKTYAANLYENAEPATDYCTHDFARVFGKTVCTQALRCLPMSNIDLIFPNIIVNETGSYVIDYEWIFPFSVPQEFVIWRALHMAWHQNEIIRRHFTLSQLLDICDVPKALAPVFEAWHDHFVDAYVSDPYQRRYYGNLVNVEPLVSDQFAALNPTAKLYLDYGHGFREEDALTQKVRLKDGQFTLHFNLKDIAYRYKDAQPRAIRFDPTDAMAVISELKAEDNGRDLELIPDGGLRIKDNTYYFDDRDARYLLKGDLTGMHAVTFTGKLGTNFYDILNDATQGLTEKDTYIAHKAEENAALKQRVAQLEEVITGLYNSQSWRITRPLRHFKEKLKNS